MLLDFAFELGYPAFDVRLHLVRTFVLRNRREHVLQAFELFSICLGGFERLFGVYIFRRKICGHFVSCFPFLGLVFVHHYNYILKQGR